MSVLRGTGNPENRAGSRPEAASITPAQPDVMGAHVPGFRGRRIIF
jgi:hypothetical protein